MLQDFENPRIWAIPKPFLVDYFAPYSVYDPKFHKRKPEKVAAPLDPCCTSCREPSSQVTLTVYVTDESYQPILDPILENGPEIEDALNQKLKALHERSLVEHAEENLPGMPDWEKHWNFIVEQLGGDVTNKLDRFFKLTGITIVWSESEKEWVVGYEFQTAWDMDHGIEILMWNEKVLAAGGMFELTYGSSLIKGAKAVQEYQLDPGDYRIP